MSNEYVCDRNACCGCMSCMNICPVDAIFVEYDSLNVPIALINTEKCTKCGLCKKACPANSPESYYRADTSEQPCFALWTNNLDDRSTCSSGGIATTFSRHVLRGGGVVFGARFDCNPLRLCHGMIESEDEIDALKGSKYVQSDIAYTYRQAKRELESGRFVLFIGTPCQIAGLRGYLRKPYGNLLTLDFVCHGVPPMPYLSGYINEICPDKNITEIMFRGEYDFMLSLINKGEPIYRQPSGADLYYSAFLSGLIFRNSCYSCPFTNTNRVSDITVGDFWGLDRSAIIPSYEGRISLMLINTKNGKSFWEDTKHSFTVHERPLGEAVDGNPQLRRPSKCSAQDRSIFVSAYPESGFSQALQKTSLIKQVKKAKFKSNIKATPLGSALLRLKRKLF